MLRLRALPGGQQLAADALGEGLRADVAERLMSDPHPAR
jgi:hypothetical protein